MAPSNNNGGGSSPSTPRRSDHGSNLTHRRHHSIANDTINDMVGSISTPTPPSSAPRSGLRRHNRHATHSHIDLDINNYTEDGMSDWSISGGKKKSSAMAMAQYLDDVESSDRVHDITSFQDVNLDGIEKGSPGRARSSSTPGRHYRHTSSDSFGDNSSTSSHSHHHHHSGQAPRRARRMYYFMPMIWKHRYPIVACLITFLVFVIAISVSVKSSMNVARGDAWKTGEPAVKELPPRYSNNDNNNNGGGEEEAEVVGPPLEISSDENKEENGEGAMTVGPGDVFQSDSSTLDNRTPCMTSEQCEERADLLQFPTYDEGPFEQKGCYYRGSVVYWGMGSTTTNDDEEDNDLTKEELTAPMKNDDMTRLWCDTDEELIQIDKAAAALSIATDKHDATGDDVDAAFTEILNQGEGEEGAMIVGENFPVTSNEQEAIPVHDDEDIVEGGGGDGMMVVGSPLQTDSANPEDHINAEWFTTDSPLYISLVVNGFGPHKTASDFCEQKGKSLCIYNQYCPEGKSTRVYKGGPDGEWVNNPAESEQWAPMKAHSDDSAPQQWVQIGKIANGGDASENFGQCWTYADWTNRGEDDTTMVRDEIDESRRRFFLCCDN